MILEAPVGSSPLPQRNSQLDVKVALAINNDFLHFGFQEYYP